MRGVDEDALSPRSFGGRYGTRTHDLRRVKDGEALLSRVRGHEVLRAGGAPRVHLDRVERERALQRHDRGIGARERGRDLVRDPFAELVRAFGPDTVEEE